MINLEILTNIPTELGGIIKIQDLRRNEDELVSSKNMEEKILQLTVGKFVGATENLTFSNSLELLSYMRENSRSLNSLKRNMKNNDVKIRGNSYSLTFGDNNQRFIEKCYEFVQSCSTRYFSYINEETLTNAIKGYDFSTFTDEEIINVLENIDFRKNHENLYKKSKFNIAYKKNMILRKCFPILNEFYCKGYKMYITKEFCEILDEMDKIISLTKRFPNEDMKNEIFHKFVSEYICGNSRFIKKNKKLNYSELLKFLILTRKGIEYTKECCDNAEKSFQMSIVEDDSLMSKIFTLFLTISSSQNPQNLFEKYFKDDYLDVIFKDYEIDTRLKYCNVETRMPKMIEYLNDMNSKQNLTKILRVLPSNDDSEEIMKKILMETYGKKIQDKIIDIIYNQTESIYCQEKKIHDIYNSYSTLSKIMNLNVMNSHQLETLLSCKLSHRKLAKQYKNMNIRPNYEEFIGVCNILDESTFDSRILLDTIELNKHLKPHNRLVKIKELMYILVQVKDFMREHLFKEFMKNKGHEAILKFLKEKGNININQYIGVKKGHHEQDAYITKAIFDSYAKTNSSLEEFKLAFRKMKFSFITKEDDSHLDLLNLYLHYLKDLEEDAFYDIFKQSKTLKELAGYLNVSKKFIINHFEECMSFCLSSNYDIFCNYMNNKVPTKTVKDNFRLITIALILGKYDELKYNYDDLQKEIGMDLDYDTYLAWKKDDSLKYDDILVQDVGDYKSIMTIGEKPSRTCMNYKNGMYSQCLISNFDTCKKILKLYDRGIYAGRAILRLTVLSDNKMEYPNNEITFKNFLEESDEISSQSNEKDNRKELVVFVEKLYTNNSGSVKKYKEAIIEFLKEKEELMGVKFVLSYVYDIPHTDKRKGWIQINKSKNSSQYMDSFYGETEAVSSLHCNRTHYYNVADC